MGRLCRCPRLSAGAAVGPVRPETCGASVNMSTPTLSINANWLTRSRVGVAVLLVIAYGVIPFTGSEYLLDAILTPFLALALAAVGLNVLTGYAGQVSLGSAAFLAVGAYAAYNFNLRIPELPSRVTLVWPGMVGRVLGLVSGRRGLRLRGFYLGCRH